MDFQGNLDKKFSVTWRWSDKPARPKEKDSWPSPEENAERLQDAGEPVDRGIVKCSNCEQLGHMKAKCPEEPNEVDRPVVKCYNCDGIGHRVRDCECNHASCPISHGANKNLKARLHVPTSSLAATASSLVIRRRSVSEIDVLLCIITNLTKARNPVRLRVSSARNAMRVCFHSQNAASTRANENSWSLLS